MIGREKSDSDYWPTSRLVISAPDESMRLQQLGIVDAEPLFDLVEADRDHFLPYGSDFADTVGDVGQALTNIALTRPDRMRFGIWDGGELRGETGLVYRAGATAETYWWIGGEHTQKGYATRAQKLLGAWSFTAGKLASLYATIHQDNIYSRGVAENAGFVPDEQQEDVIRYIKFKPHQRSD